MCVRIAITFIVNGKVYTHTLRNKMLPTKAFQHGRILLTGDFYRERKNNAAGKQRVPLFFNFLSRIP